MTQITFKLKDEVYKILTNQALKKGLSTEEELNRIVENNLEPQVKNMLSKEEFILWAKEFKKQVGPQKTDSTNIIRELRENS